LDSGNESTVEFSLAIAGEHEGATGEAVVVEPEKN
jgi:hypothetical protein